jgi:hypothetical protein
VSEISVFLRLAKGGGLAPELLGRAIRRRWPEADEAELCEALRRAAEDSVDPDDRLAMEVAAAAILKGG